MQSQCCGRVDTMANFALVCTVLILPLVSGVTLRVNDKPISTTSKPYASTYKNYEKDDDYGFSYGVSDANTGDHKIHWEKRENGVVQGAYSLLEPDGSTRLVQYTADDSGFHPLVQKLNQPVSNIPYPVTTPSYYRPTSLYYTRPYARPTIYPNTGYNYNGRYYFPDTASYRPPISLGNRDYRTGYLNRYSGYDSSYKGYDGIRTPLGVPPYNLGQQAQQPVPLLHSTYHGYDNLYH